MLSTFVVCEENLLVLGGPDAVTWDLVPLEGSLLERELTVVLSKTVWCRDKKLLRCRHTETYLQSCSPLIDGCGALIGYCSACTLKLAHH